MRNQVDRLADIRTTVRALRAEARAIQAQILGGEVPAEGDEHVATVRRQIVLKPIEQPTEAELAELIARYGNIFVPSEQKEATQREYLKRLRAGDPMPHPLWRGA